MDKNNGAPMAARAVLAVVAISSLAGCATSPRGATWTGGREDLSKIKFDLAAFHPDGLRGPPDGLISVAYYFYVPADEGVYAEVRRIDPSVKITPGGRAGDAGGPGLAYCQGSTSQPHWREVLGRLSALSYVKEIRECFFEK